MTNAPLSVKKKDRRLRVNEFVALYRDLSDRSLPHWRSRTRNGSNMFLMEPHRRPRWIMKHEFNLRHLEIHLNLEAIASVTKWSGLIAKW